MEREQSAGPGRTTPALRPVSGGFWLITLVSVVILFYGLGRLPLLGFSEGRYASIAAEMWRSGDWVTPRYGGVKHLEKPPLAYWGAAVMYEARGLAEGSARLPAAFSAFVLVLMTAWITTRRFGPVAGQLAALVLLTFPMQLAMGHVLFTDMILAVGCVLHVVAALEGARVTGSRRLAWAALGGLGIGIAILSKFHLILLVATAPLVVEAIWARSRRLAWMAFHPLSWGVGIGLCLPWILAMLDDNPGLVDWVVEYQTRDRVLSEVHDRTGPPWFYLGWMPIAIFPWIFLLPAVARDRREPEGKGGAAPVFGRRFLWIWFLLPFVVFSLIGSKRFNYLPPILPPLAMLIALACAVDPREGSRGSALAKWVYRLCLGVPAALLLALPLVATFVDLPGVTLWTVVPGLAFAVAAAFQERRMRTPRQQGLALRFAFLYAGCLAILVPVVFDATAAYAPRMGHHAAAAAVARPYAERDVPVVMYHLEAASTSFYLAGRPLVLVGVPRQIQFEDPEVVAKRYFPDDSPEEKARTDRMLADAMELVFITRKHERLAHLEERLGLALEVLFDRREYIVARLRR